MHRIKGQAKREAWYAAPDEPQGWIRNPFGKYKAPTNTRSNTSRTAENGDFGGPISETQSELDGGGRTAALQRRNELRDKSPPAHANTLPQSISANTTAAPQTYGDIRRSTSPDAEGPERIPEEPETNGKDSGETSDTVPTDEKPQHHGFKDNIEEKLHLRRDTKASHMSTPSKRVTDDDNNNGKTKQKKKFTPMSQVRGTILNSWINVLLIASPIGIAIYYAHVNPVAVFVVNFIAIIPLAGMLSYATEEIALRVGETLGGLLNATFGNAVELIVSVIALAQHQVLIVQTSLIGSMLSNLLLVMGMCFFFGGFNRMEQAFNVTVAQTASSLLFLAVSALIIPTAFDAWAKTLDTDATNSRIRQLSRGTAILLLIVYACYLFFQLKSHAEIYNKPSEKNEKRDMGKTKAKVKNRFHKARGQPQVQMEDTSRPETPEDDKDEPEEPQLSLTTAIATLAASTVLVALNAEYLVDSINAVTCDGGINKNFVGLILLPIVGNAAEHATAVTVAVKDKMDLAIGVAVGSSMQIALLVLPFTVVLGWIMDRPGMTLEFDGFQIAILFVAVLLVNYLIQDGKSHWLEGVLLQILYIIIAMAAWFYPAAAALSADCPSK